MIEQTAGIVAQVQHDASQLAAGLFFHRRQGCVEILIDLVGKLLDLDHAVAGLQQERLDAAHLDQLTRNQERTGLFPAFAQQRELNLGPALAAHPLYIVEHAPGCLVVDLLDLVPGDDACARGWSTLHHRQHRQDTVADIDLDTDPGKLPGGIALHLFVLLGTQERRVRVQRVEHALDRAVNQLVLIYFFDVVGLDVGQDPRKHRQLSKWAGFSRHGRCHSGE